MITNDVHVELGFRRTDGELWEISVLPSDNPDVAHRLGNLKVSDVTFSDAVLTMRYVIGRRFPEARVFSKVFLTNG